MGTPLGPKYIPFTYMDPLVILGASEYTGGPKPFYRSFESPQGNKKQGGGECVGRQGAQGSEFWGWMVRYNRVSENVSI